MHAQELQIELTKSDSISAITIIDLLLRQAYEEHASDIHIDPEEHTFSIKFRIDGILIHKYHIQKSLEQELLCRIKILAKLRIDEHLLPQDGRLRLSVDSEVIDIRVSIIPSYYGESIVLRLLHDSTSASTLTELGMNPEQANLLSSIINHNHGMIVVTGPTGSGKTTTLYTLLKMIHTGKRSLITIEDPIEYAIPGVRQIQVHTHKGLTFAHGLRAILRQDPDIIMVGEIRDHETASIAIQTALTGHMLFTTLHTPNASTALPRFLDMGIDSYLIASTIDVIVSQRLIRKLCDDCKIRKNISNLSPYEEQCLLKADIISLPEEFCDASDGCATCNYTGFNGRIGIYEVLQVNDDIRAAIMNKAPAHVIHAQALKNKMQPLWQQGYQKVVSGMTSISEVEQTLHE